MEFKPENSFKRKKILVTYHFLFCFWFNFINKSLNLHLSLELVYFLNKSKMFLKSADDRCSIFRRGITLLKPSFSSSVDSSERPCGNDSCERRAGRRCCTLHCAEFQVCLFLGCLSYRQQPQNACKCFWFFWRPPGLPLTAKWPGDAGIVASERHLWWRELRAVFSWSQYLPVVLLQSSTQTSPSPTHALYCSSD